LKASTTRLATEAQNDHAQLETLLNSLREKDPLLIENIKLKSNNDALKSQMEFMIDYRDKIVEKKERILMETKARNQELQKLETELVQSLFLKVTGNETARSE
jgi:hypothetical protein